MRIKRVELNNFKRFTHLTVDSIPATAKLVVLVGPNGSGKTSFMEAMNHYYKYSGYRKVGDPRYLSKTSIEDDDLQNKWFNIATQTVDIDFYDVTFPKDYGNSDIKSHFYFRSAYRNESDFDIQAMQRQGDPTESIRLDTLMQNDQSVSDNYQRLIANTVFGVFDEANSNKTVEALRKELIGIIRTSIEHIFEDLKFSSLGEPLVNGNFYFTKGTAVDFHYKNLSAGEKSAFDLILDMVIKSKYYPDAVYCIDEPEAHMHTKLQGKVLRELYSLVPGSSQLWLSTHSIGMLQEAEDIEKENPGTVVFLDFDGRDFDTDEVIRPVQIGRAAIDKFYELAFGDFSKLMLPKRIVFCEGDPNGRLRKDFDKTIYMTIFGNTYPDTLFISGGSCNNIEGIENTLGEVMTKLLASTEVIKIVDRDDRTEQEVADLLQKNIKTLSERHLESYLLDDSIIEKLCVTKSKSEKYRDCLVAKNNALESVVTQGRPNDDVKSASGEIYIKLKQILDLTQCGNNKSTFLRDTMAPLITPDTEIYKKLERDIFTEKDRDEELGNG